MTDEIPRQRPTDPSLMVKRCTDCGARPHLARNESTRRWYVVCFCGERALLQEYGELPEAWL